MEYALSGHHDGIIMDIMMPELDGLQVLKRLWNIGYTLEAGNELM